ncbi:hypothetical protein M406DRAFT_253504 [Cryphonectria parasitica EP155]|uniref:PQ loop repeat protein n=1 Tax=Cryphonectria parasitica (strain ATCC 38755 / EP155) TaxID=660469 RepID=A0A9P5CQW1_CRYP1|nr:uncharacterized protein M406DRAFT_253504 [Cryphonectria parasitica EP155]KAF3767613.1 hypothetical protein M406DRAFT_253504 [Cryphonectria parasitica EP155]
MDILEDKCSDLRDPGFVNLVVSVIIVIGMLISYMPQHYRIISRGTSEGISPYFVLLGTTSATAGFTNILTLPKSIQDAGCCQELETFECVAGVLGIVQLGVQWACFAFIFILFLVFFRYATANIAEEELEDAEEEPRWQTAVMVATVVLVHILLTVIISAVIVLIYPSHLNSWAIFNGVLAAGLAAVQYIPQIAMTYHLKHVGSLSIPMMCIQTPGGLLFAASLAVRLGWAGWSTWGIFLLTAIMQGILLFMALYYVFVSNGSTDDPTRPPMPRSLSRVYANGLDENTPTRYTGHPEHYATSQDQLGDILDRQDSDAAAETQPLLRPGGIGNSSSIHRYDGH